MKDKLYNLQTPDLYQSVANYLCIPISQKLQPV